MRSKRPAPGSERDWLDLAYQYCGRRETSKPKLRQYLYRKLGLLELGLEMESAHPAWIENALNQCEKLRLIDHGRFAGILTRESERQGKGRLYIAERLMQNGVEEEIEKLKSDPKLELERALKLARQSLKLSRFKTLTDPEMIRYKLLQKLSNAGFEEELAERAVELALE